MNKIIWIFVALLSCAATARGQDGDPVSFANNQKAAIAVDVNILRSMPLGVIQNARLHGNIFDPSNTPYDAIEKQAVLRSFSGMQLMGHEETADMRSAVFYNPALDIGLLLGWDDKDDGSFQIVEAFVVPGEMLRGSQVKDVMPDWTSDMSLLRLGNYYTDIKERQQSYALLANSARSNSRHVIKNETLSDRDIALRRMHYMTNPVDASVGSETGSESYNQASVKAAIDANNLKHYIRKAHDLKEALEVAQDRLRIKVVSIPIKYPNPDHLSTFLYSVFVEGAVTKGNISFSLLSSASNFNNYLIVLSEEDGKPIGLSLIDLDNQ